MSHNRLPETVSGQQLAEILGLTARRIDQLAEESAVSKTGAKSFELKFSVQD